MAQPKASPLSFYTETPEEQATLEKYRQSQKDLLAALESRQNQLFDPTLLAMAQGFLAPTKTGSFGESLGNVAARLGPVQEEEQKRAVEMAQIRQELAAQELGMQQATRGERQFRELLGGAPAAPAGGPSGAAGPAGAPSAAPVASAGGLRPLSEADVLRVSLMPGQSDKAKLLADLMKTQRDRFMISQNGIVFDKVEGKYLDLEIPGQKQEAFSTPYGRFEMTPNEYAQFARAEREGKGQEWINRFKTPGGMGPGRKTVEEQQAAAKAAETRAVETAKSETGRTQQAIEAGDVTGRLASYNALDAIASRKDAKEVFGILNRPDVSSAILTLVEGGLRPGASGTISAPALENALRNINLPQDLINRYQFALGVMANIQLQQSKLASGQGAVSDRERDLFAQASISPKDNPETILKKVAMLRARAELDRDIARELIDSGKSLDQFKRENKEQYNRMVDSYLSRVENIASSFGIPAARPRVPPSAAGASEDLRRRLGL